MFVSAAIPSAYRADESDYLYTESCGTRKKGIMEERSKEILHRLIYSMALSRD